MLRRLTVWLLLLSFFPLVACQPAVEIVEVTREVVNTPAVVVVTSVSEVVVDVTEPVVEQVVVTAVVTPTPEPTVPPTPIATSGPVSTPIPTVTPPQLDTLLNLPPNVQPQPFAHRLTPAELSDRHGSGYVAMLSDAQSESQGVVLELWYPRDWQHSYFQTESGGGWLISDGDPNRAYWDETNSSDAILFGLTSGIDNETAAFSSDDTVYEFVTVDRITMRYTLSGGIVRGYVANRTHAFTVFGFIPEGRMDEGQIALEKVLSSLEWAVVYGDLDPLSLGTRDEGPINSAAQISGYIAPASWSYWSFEADAGTVIRVELTNLPPNLDVSLILVDASRSIAVSGVATPIEGGGAWEFPPLAQTGFYGIFIGPFRDGTTVEPIDAEPSAGSYGRYDILLSTPRQQDAH